jgi:hypothetical protein
MNLALWNLGGSWDREDSRMVVIYLEFSEDVELHDEFHSITVKVSLEFIMLQTFQWKVQFLEYQSSRRFRGKFNFWSIDLLNIPVESWIVDLVKFEDRFQILIKPLSIFTKFIQIFLNSPHKFNKFLIAIHKPFHFTTFTQTLHGNFSASKVRFDLLLT